MKITASRIKRIINEELSRLLTETSQARSPWNSRMGTGRRLPADWADSYEKLKDEFTQWFTDRDEAAQFLSDVQLGGFEATARDWEPTMLLGRQGWEEIRQTLVDRGYMEPSGRFVIPDKVGGHTEVEEYDVPVVKDLSRDERMTAGIKMKMDDSLDKSYRDGYWDGIIGNRRSYVWVPDRLPPRFDESEYERGYAEGNALHPNTQSLEVERGKKTAQDEDYAERNRKREEENRIARARRDPEVYPDDERHALTEEERLDMESAYDEWVADGRPKDGRFKKVSRASTSDSMYGRGSGFGTTVGTKVIDTVLNVWVPGTQTSGSGGSLGT